MREFFLTVVIGLSVLLTGVLFVITMTPLFIAVGAIFAVSFIFKGFFIDDYG